MPASDSESTACQLNAQTHEPVIGIDLGTTNSLVAVSDERGPRIIADGDDPRLVSSVVGFPRDGDGAVLVGAQALELAEREPERVVASAKRLMGRSRAELETLRHVLPLSLSEGPRGMATVQVAGNEITPQEVSAHILGALRARAERSLGRTISRAVITVPAYFDDAQRHATRDAARLAGLSVARIVNEPTAAALAYGLLERTEGERLVVVYDLGGGTFDVSVLRMLGKGHDPDAPGEALVEVVATAGDTQLGGDDFTGELVDAILESVGFDLARRQALSAIALGAVRVAAESLKCALSDADSAAVTVDLNDPLLPSAIDFTIDRATFDARIASRIACTIDACRNVLADAQLTTDEVERVILVGGSTRVPAVREAVKLFFGREAYSALDPDEVVALGAAVQGSILSGDRQDLLLLDVLALSLGIETVGGAVAKLLMRNSAVPAQAIEQFSTSVDGQTSVRLHVLQGERELVEHCRSLGVMHLRDIPPMPAGIPKIEVEFNVDADGVLSVHAVERRSDRRASIQVVPSHGLTDEEIERIEKESFTHAREDMHLHRVIDLRVNAALDLKWTRSALARVQAVISPELARTIESLCAELEDEIKNASVDPASVDADRFYALKERLAHESVPMQEAAITQSLRSESE